MDYDVFAVLSEYFIINIIIATQFQIHWPGIDQSSGIRRCRINT